MAQETARRVKSPESREAKSAEESKEQVEKQETTVDNGQNQIQVRQEAGLPTTIDFEEDLAGGFENVTSKDFKIPIVRVLQSGSPEIDEDNPKYIPGAKAGSLYNISTKEIYDGKDGIWVIPCGFHKKWVEFVPREKGGGYVDEYLPNDTVVRNAVKADKGTAKMIKATGNTLTETGYFPCLIVKSDGSTDQIVITVSSAAWNFSKDWLNVMRKKVIIKNGKPMSSPPAFWSHMYRIGSHTVKNSQYSWKQFCLIEDRMLTDKDVRLYLEAREFNRISNALKFGADAEAQDHEGSSSSASADETEY